MNVTDEQLATLRRQQAELHAALAQGSDREAAATLAVQRRIIDAVVGAGPRGATALVMAQTDLLIRDALIERGIAPRPVQDVSRTKWKATKAKADAARRGAVAQHHPV